MQSCSAFSAYESGRPELSWGCPILDRQIGRIAVGGEAGSGKTQICLKMCLSCQLPKEQGGLDGGAAYLTAGEGDFPIRRLQQLAHQFEMEVKPKWEAVRAFNLLQRVQIEQFYCIEELIRALKDRVPGMCRANGVRLLVIDSIAGLIRSEYDTSTKVDMMARTRLLFQLSQNLKWLSDEFQICIIVVNQATSSGFEENYPSNIESLGLVPSELLNVKPALGLVWATCVNSRILLLRDTTSLRVNTDIVSPEQGDLTSDINRASNSRNTNSMTDVNVYDETSNRFPADAAQSIESVERITPQTRTISSTASRSVRLMCLEFSPRYPPNVCSFEITSSGVHGISIYSD